MNRRMGPVKGRTRCSVTQETGGDGGPEEAVAFIAESTADLTALARRHKLELLGFLLAMVRLEAEEHVRLRSKRNLS